MFTIIHIMKGLKMSKKEYHAIPKFYYLPDSWGVPDGKTKLSSVSCSCGQVMNWIESESVDCGAVHHYECPDRHTAYSEWDLIENC